MQNRVERIRRVQLRVRQLEVKKERFILASLSSISVLSVISLVGSIFSLAGGGRLGECQGFCGALMLYEKAGSYVLVALLAFIGAVLITLLCIHSREKAKKNDKDWEEE